MVQPLRKTVSWFLTKLNILLPYDPAITLFDIYPNKLKIYPYKNLHANVYSINITAKTGRQSRCPSVGGG